MGQRHRHVQVVDAGAERGPEQRHHEPGVGRVHQRVAAALGEQPGHGPLVPGVQLRGLVPVAGRGRALRPLQVIVGDDQLGEGAPGGDLGQRRTDPARAHQKYAHAPMLTLARVIINETSRCTHSLQLKSLRNSAIHARTVAPGHWISLPCPV